MHCQLSFSSVNEMTISNISISYGWFHRPPTLEDQVPSCSLLSWIKISMCTMFSYIVNNLLLSITLHVLKVLEGWKHNPQEFNVPGVAIIDLFL